MAVLVEPRYDSGTRVVVIFAAIVALNLSVGRAQSGAADEASVSCEALTIVDFSELQDAPTQITQANLVHSNGDAPDYCQVIGYVAPQVGFELRLPTSSWNGKFIKVGCGGVCGALLPSSCDASLRKGYACIVSDMGHRGKVVRDGLWAHNNLQTKIDWAYRATHVSVLAGKAITERYYHRTPERSYFMGCSTGGRQGLLAAQRFPWDFDGIIAGAPAIDSTALLLNLLWSTIAAEDQDGNPVFSLSALHLMHDAVISKCDLDDGVKDGVVGNPSMCRFDPSELACRSGRRPKSLCLTEMQVGTARKIYAGATTSSGENIYPGAAMGSELNWISFAAPFAENSERSSGRSNFNQVRLKDHSVELFRYMALMPDAGPSWKLRDVDFDRDFKRLGLMESLYSASNPDLRRFKAAGGKLIVYQGWNDEAVVPGKTIDYYETAERTMGGRERTQEFFRLFMLPGVNHCWGGDGADAVDFLGYLEAWVERGQGPDYVLSAHVRPESGSFYPYRQFPAVTEKVMFTRPVYPYPSRAVYQGRGDPNDAESFRRVDP